MKDLQYDYKLHFNYFYYFFKNGIKIIISMNLELLNLFSKKKVYLPRFVSGFFEARL